MPCKRLNSRLGKVPQWTATRLICWGTVHYPSLFFTLTSFLSPRYIFFRSSTTFSGAKSSSLSMHPPSKDRFVSPLLPFLEQTLGVQKYFVVLRLSVNLLCSCDLFNLARSCVCASWKLGYWKFRVLKLCVSPFFFLSIMVFSPL